MKHDTTCIADVLASSNHTMAENCEMYRVKSYGYYLRINFLLIRAINHRRLRSARTLEIRAIYNCLDAKPPKINCTTIRPVEVIQARHMASNESSGPEKVRQRSAAGDLRFRVNYSGLIKMYDTAGAQRRVVRPQPLSRKMQRQGDESVTSERGTLVNVSVVRLLLSGGNPFSPGDFNRTGRTRRIIYNAIFFPLSSRD